MRQILKSLKTLLLGLGIVALATVPVSAQTNPPIADLYRGADQVGQYVAADDTDVPFLLLYFGTGQSGKAEVAATAINLISGVVGAEVADTTVECPISGAAGGILAIDNAACDTVGELADIVNGTVGSKWRMIPLDSLRSDTIFATDKKILTAASAQAKTVDGLNVFWDTSTRLFSQRAFTSYRSAKFYLDSNFNLKPNPFKGERVAVFSIDAVATFTGAAGGIRVTEVLYAANPQSNKYTETVRGLANRPMGATTVYANIAFNGHGIVGGRDRKLLFIYSAATTFGTVGASSSALQYGYQPQ